MCRRFGSKKQKKKGSGPTLDSRAHPRTSALEQHLSYRRLSKITIKAINASYTEQKAQGNMGYQGPFLPSHPPIF